MTWGDDGWLRTTDGDGHPARSRSPAPGAAAAAVPGGARARGLRRRRRCRSTSSGCASPWPGRAVQPDARARATCACTAARRSAACSARRSSRGGSRRTASARRPSMEFEPEHFQQMAGLVCYYNSAKFHYLYVSHDETVGKHLRVMSALPDQVQADAFTRADRRSRPACRSSCASRSTTSGCASPIASATATWHWLPQQFDASILSDEATRAGPAELHRRVRRHGLPGPGRHRRCRRTSTGSSIRERDYVADRSGDRLQLRLHT